MLILYFSVFTSLFKAGDIIIVLVILDVPAVRE